jgi:hypothetical protein
MRYILAALAIAGCSSTTAPAVEEQPKHAELVAVVVTAASIKAMGDGEHVTLTLKNNGGPGFFRVDFWGLPLSPGGSNTHYGQSEAIEVTAGWQLTATWVVPTGAPHGATRVRWVIVSGRDHGEVAWRQTDRHDL